jgi:hypothetical protein
MGETQVDHIGPNALQQRLDIAHRRWALCYESPYWFQRFWVWTADQHRPDDPCRQWCYDKEYLQVLTSLWLWNPRLSVVKSRQMRLTWLFVILSLWDAIFRRGRLIMLQSKREEDAIGDENAGDGLLGRAKYILRHMPLRDELLPEVEFRQNQLKFLKQGSTLWAIPQGGSIIRQRTASGILSDEAAFQPECADSYVAARPTIRGARVGSGGWYVSLTTPDLADGGHTRRLHQDELDDY